MTTTPHHQLLTALQNLADFAQSIHAEKESAALLNLHTRIASGQLNQKQIEQEAWTLRGLTLFKLSRIISKTPPDKVLTLARFTADLAKADQRFGGPALLSNIERITTLYADAPSRLSSNRLANWPAKTPKPNKRAILGAFWFTNSTEHRGRWITLWITEENKSYRIAKFTQYLQ